MSAHSIVKRSVFVLFITLSQVLSQTAQASVEYVTTVNTMTKLHRQNALGTVDTVFETLYYKIETPTSLAFYKFANAEVEAECVDMIIANNAEFPSDAPDRRDRIWVTYASVVQSSGVLEGISVREVGLCYEELNYGSI